jgi:hypothetical protein
MVQLQKSVGVMRALFAQERAFRLAADHAQSTLGMLGA